MRISITSERDLIQELEAAMKANSDIKTESPRHVADRTELQFSIADAATIIAITTGAAKLIEYLIVISRHLKEGRKQKLLLKTALGTVTLDLHCDVNAEDLRRLLQTLEPRP